MSRRRVDPKMAAIGALPMFRSASFAELRRIAAIADIVELAPGTVVRTSKHRYLVLDGVLAMSVGGEPLATIGRGELVGEATGCDVTAISTVTALAISRRALKPLLATSESLRTAMIDQLETRVRQLLLR